MRSNPVLSLANPRLRARLLLIALVLGICGLEGFLLGQAAGHQALLAQASFTKDARPAHTTLSPASSPASQPASRLGASNDASDNQDGSHNEHGGHGHGGKNHGS